MANGRFQTTTQTGLETIAARRDELESRAVINANLKNRKLANTKTSISFGNHATLYQSDAQSRQLDILNAQHRDIAAEKQKMHEMKMHLKYFSNISFGDEALDYKQDSTMLDPTGHLKDYTGVLNKDVERSIKRSSIHFGNASTEYESEGHRGMRHGVENGEKIDFVKQKAETKNLTKELRASNFSFGDTPTDYSTDHLRGYQPYSSEQQTTSRGHLAKEVKKDLRQCHFSLGNDATAYITAQSDIWNVGEKLISGTVVGGRDPKKDREDAKKLKLSLQKTSFVIGDDEDYM